MTKEFIARPSRTQVGKMTDYTLADASSQESRGPDFWREAVPLYPSRNRRLARLRLDPEILDWFGTQRDDPHGGVNAVLRAYVERRRADGQSSA
ncbi:MAG TPA: hypothetical protein VG942_01355 [Hyphomonadaceae bacterium]|nr:hypothetical protein [Hyphomonadaceae bacterium]